MTSEKCKHCGKTEEEHYISGKTIFCSPLSINDDEFEPQSNSQDGFIREDEQNDFEKRLKNRRFFWIMENKFIENEEYEVRALTPLELFKEGQKQERDKVLKEIEKLIKLRKGSLNWNVSEYEEIFSINDLNSIKSKLSEDKDGK